MAKLKPNQIKDAADAILANGVTTRNAFIEAVPYISKLEDALRNVSDFRSKLDATLKRLKEKSALYAEEHPKALDAPISDYKDGLKRGTVTIDGRVFHLTISKGEFKRIDGGNITAEFLATLPESWKKTETVLDKSSLKKASPSDTELAKNGLYRETKRTWSWKAEEAA